MELANIGNSPELPLFRGIVHTKSGEQLRKRGGISYTHVREIVLEKLSELGLDWKLFGLHSSRSGGASARHMLVSLTGSLNATGDGAVKMQRMATSRTRSVKVGCQCQRELVSDSFTCEHSRYFTM